MFFDIAKPITYLFTPNVPLEKENHFVSIDLLLKKESIKLKYSIKNCIDFFKKYNSLFMKICIVSAAIFSLMLLLPSFTSLLAIIPLTFSAKYFFYEPWMRQTENLINQNQHLSEQTKNFENLANERAQNIDYLQKDMEHLQKEIRFFIDYDGKMLAMHEKFNQTQLHLQIEQEKLTRVSEELQQKTLALHEVVKNLKFSSNLIQQQLLEFSKKSSEEISKREQTISKRDETIRQLENKTFL